MNWRRRRSSWDVKSPRLRDRMADIDHELGAIAAYHERMSGRDRSLDAQVQVRLGRVGITREAVLAVVRGEADGLSRAGIIEALGVKGIRSSETAVDNRLRELKKRESVLHEGRMYRAA